MDSHVLQRDRMVRERQNQLLAETAQRRLVSEARAHRTAEPASRASERPLNRIWAAFATRMHRDHAVVDHPCRLPGGQVGRVALVLLNDEWTRVCRLTS